MIDDSLWREKAREIIQAEGLSSQSAADVAESTAIVQRLFALAAQCVGGASALARQLGLPYSELGTYLTGEAMPPEEVLLRTVALVIEHRKVVVDNP
ncbi:MAG TPA: hypothetical protein VGJ39_08855 [Vicinamibacterales bacterium]